MTARCSGIERGGRGDRAAQGCLRCQERLKGAEDELEAKANEVGLSPQRQALMCPR